MYNLVAYLSPLEDALASIRQIAVYDLSEPSKVLKCGTVTGWDFTTIQEWCREHGFVLNQTLLQGFAYSLSRR